MREAGSVRAERSLAHKNLLLNNKPTAELIALFAAVHCGFWSLFVALQLQTTCCKDIMSHRRHANKAKVGDSSFTQNVRGFKLNSDPVFLLRLAEESPGLQKMLMRARVIRSNTREDMKVFENSDI